VNTPLLMRFQLDISTKKNII